MNQERSTSFWQEPFDVRPLVDHVDSRGFLFEILRFKEQDVPGAGQLYTLSIEPGARRGDHYHLKKQEWFTCVYGEAIVLLSHPSGEKTAVHLTHTEPKVVYAGPETAHALINKTEDVAIIVSYGSKEHNPEDEDTYRQVAYESYADSA